jgi:hypothetical protein
MRKSIRCLAAMCAVSFVASGCASVSLTPEALDVEAKRFAPPERKANIYVTRTSPFAGAVLFQIYLNGRIAGSIAQDTYLLFEVEPGSHQLAVMTPESQHIVVVTAAANDSHFVEAIPRVGFMQARAELQPQTKEEGKRAVLQSKRAELLNLNPSQR